MNDLTQRVKNAQVMNGGMNRPSLNTPSQYQSRKYQYFADESAAFIQQYAKYSSDFFEAQVQGLSTENFYEWQTQNIRMADVVRLSASATKEADDFKLILFESERVDYFPAGAKVETMGSTWICINPQNMSGVSSTSIIRRCNATWNHLDFYGNVLKEPIIIQKSNALANDNDEQPLVLITKGYFDVIAQYNPQTAQLGQNSRLILGSSAYAITGFTDFFEEFTGDTESVHLVRFSVRYQETNETDDLQNRVAGGKTFRWEISVSGRPVLGAGDSAQFTAVSMRNGEAVSSSAENPVSYLWTSSNEDVATVNADGMVTAINEGSCTITAALEQNDKIYTEYQVEVTGTGKHLEFLPTPPEIMRPYENVTLEATVFENGQPTDEKITWVFEGASSDSFTAKIMGNKATISCWSGSVKPLKIMASNGELSVSANVKLEGI